MGYYRGDYYSGGYYTGGIISSLGKLIGRAAPFAAGFIPGVGGVVARTIGRGGGVVGRLGGKVGPVLKATGKIAAGGAIFEAGSKAVDRFFGGGGGGGTGHHRRMNVANVKALRRAIRRARGFEKLARRVLTYPFTKPPKGRGMFKKKRRAA